MTPFPSASISCMTDQGLPPVPDEALFSAISLADNYLLKFRTPLERVIGSQQFEIVTFFWNGGS